jgi:IS30 family transposase
MERYIGIDVQTASCTVAVLDVEMAQHADFTVATGVEVFFCDPQSPWQRGTNENTNGLLRQYFPKRQPVDSFSQAQLDAIARKLNVRFPPFGGHQPTRNNA